MDEYVDEYVPLLAVFLITCFEQPSSQRNIPMDLRLAKVCGIVELVVSVHAKGDAQAYVCSIKG